MREAILANTTIMAVCHNHPTGSLHPSVHDDAITTSLKIACDMMRIHFLDHVIITDGNYYSYHEQGKC
jgi:DNA repair protein RadC